MSHASLVTVIQVLIRAAQKLKLPRLFCPVLQASAPVPTVTSQVLAEAVIPQQSPLVPRLQKPKTHQERNKFTRMELLGER